MLCNTYSHARFYVVFCAALLAALNLGCNSTKSQLIGKWMADSPDRWEFFSDGTCTVQSGTVRPCTYAVLDDGRVKVEVGGSILIAQFEAGKLKMEMVGNPNYHSVLQRQTPEALAAAEQQAEAARVRAADQSKIIAPPANPNVTFQEGPESELPSVGGDGTSTVSFAPGARNDSSFPNFTLTVESRSTGSGRITSSPSAIDCQFTSPHSVTDLTGGRAGTCHASFPPGTVVTLKATPSSGSIFGGWEAGPCEGAGTCQVTMNKSDSVRVNFTSG